MRPANDVHMLAAGAHLAVGSAVGVAQQVHVLRCQLEAGKEGDHIFGRGLERQALRAQSEVVA